MSTPDPARPGTSDQGYFDAPDDVTVEHTAVFAEAATNQDPLAGTEPLLGDPFAAGPVPPSGTPASPGGLGGLIPEDRPELLVAASFAGGALAAIVLRTLVRR